MKIAEITLKGIIIFLVVFLFLKPSTSNGQFFFMENDVVGEKMPDFTLDKLSGSKESLEAYRNNQEMIIFFWATWCPHCRRELTELNTVHKTLAEENIKLAVVDQGEPADVVQSYVDTNKIEFDIFLDKESELMEPFGLIGIPTYVFVDSDGIVKGTKHQLPENYKRILSGK